MLLKTLNFGMSKYGIVHHRRSLLDPLVYASEGELAVDLGSEFLCHFVQWQNWRSLVARVSDQMM
jgi:hypothetical protein